MIHHVITALLLYHNDTWNSGSGSTDEPAIHVSAAFYSLKALFYVQLKPVWYNCGNAYFYLINYIHRK
jgi:hypothetical protein